MNFTPDLNDGKHVFGSNLAGRHGKGAAYTAMVHWGAAYGIGLGRVGQAYALPTKLTPYETLTLSEVRGHVDSFVAYARQHPELTFLVTKVGCGLAGFQESDIAPMFADAPENCVLPEDWRNYAHSS